MARGPVGWMGQEKKGGKGVGKAGKQGREGRGARRSVSHMTSLDYWGLCR